MFDSSRPRKYQWSCGVVRHPAAWNSKLNEQDLAGVPYIVAAQRENEYMAKVVVQIGADSLPSTESILIPAYMQLIIEGTSQSCSCYFVLVLLLTHWVEFGGDGCFVMWNWVIDVGSGCVFQSSRGYLELKELRRLPSLIGYMLP